MYVQANQAIPRMTEVSQEETEITREERRSLEGMEKWEDLRVFDPFATEVDTDLPRSDPPRVELQSLAFQDVLIENDHPETGSSA